MRGVSLRIAQLANFVGPTSGGMKTALQALGSGYVAAGAERLLVVPGPADRRTETDSGTVVELRAPRVGGGYRLVVEPWRVVSVLESFAPTSLEVSDKTTMLPVARWARRHDVPTLLLSHERLDAMLSLRTGRERSATAVVSALNRVLVRNYDAVVVTSVYATREFAAVAAAAGTPVHRVPLGVDLDRFRPLPARRAPDGVLRLVHVGRLSREKSPHLAVLAARELHERGIAVHLDVVGDGPHAAEIAAMAGPTPATFHGFVVDRHRLARLVSDADVAISPCPGETFGLAILEALAVGTPVVTSDRGGGSELVGRRSGGWGTPDAVGLADAVLRVVHDPGVTRAGARQRAERYPWSACVSAMLRLHTAAAVGAELERRTA